jgi:adenine phosphoribosyltransferase
MSIKSLIRTIPDHPKPGIQFRDITTLLENPKGLRIAVESLAEPFLGDRIEKVVGIEARGFLFGAAVAIQLEAGFVPVRKPGKLPGKTVGRDYALEYGTDRVEIHADALRPGERVLIIDDLIATGGTAEATVRLVGDTGAEIVGCAFVIDLPDLGGSKRIADEGFRVVSLCSFEGE